MSDSLTLVFLCMVRLTKFSSDTTFIYSSIKPTNPISCFGTFTAAVFIFILILYFSLGLDTHSWIIRSCCDIGSLRISSHLNPNAEVHVINIWYNSQVVHISTYIDICLVHLYQLHKLLHYFITCAYTDCFITYAYFAYNPYMTFTHFRLPSAWFAIFRPSFCYLLFHILGAAL